MKSWQLLIAVVLMFVISAIANVEAATVSISIDGNSVDVPVRYELYGDRPGGYFEIGEYEDEPFIFDTAAGDQISLHGELHPDPSLLFGSAVFDFGAPSTFGFVFILPLAPTFPNPSVVKDSFSGSVNNGATAGGVTVTALPPPAFIPVDGDLITEMEVYTLSDDGGATWKNVGLDLGPSDTIAPLAAFEGGLYGAFNEGPIANTAGPGPWTHMRADINFSLSGDGEIFSFSGAKVLVPEPGTLILALTLLAPAYCRRRIVR